MEDHTVPELWPNTIVIAAHGTRYRIDTSVPRPIMGPEWPTDSSRVSEGIFLAETEPGNRKLVLRLFAAEPRSDVGTFAAAPWPEDVTSQVRRIGLTYSDSRGPYDWVHVRRGHPGLLNCLDEGMLVAYEPARPIHDAPGLPGSPYRASRGYRHTVAPLVSFPRPLLFVALERIEGATLASLFRAVRRRGRPLRPSSGLALATQLAAALAHLESLTVSSDDPRRLRHGKLNRDHVFVASDGTCKLLTPIRRIKHLYSGGCPNLAAWMEYWDNQDIFENGFRPAYEPDLSALGILLWKALTGRWIQDVWSGGDRTLPPPSSLCPEVPALLDACVARFLAGQGSGGFAFAREAAAALESAGDVLGWPQGASKDLAQEVREVESAGSEREIAGACDDGTFSCVALHYTATS